MLGLGGVPEGGGMKITTALAAVLLVTAPMVLSGCAMPVQHLTPSGRVEATIKAPPDAAKSRVSNFMFYRGYNVSKDTPYLMAFDKLARTSWQMHFSAQSTTPLRILG